LILNSYGKKNPNNYFFRYIQPQIAINIGLLPIIIFFWHQFPILSFIINFIAIPLFALLIVPLAFFTILTFNFKFLSTISAHILDKILTIFIAVLTWLQSNSLCLLQFPELSYLGYFFLVLGVLLILMPKGFPAKGLSYIFLLGVLHEKNTLPLKGEVNINIIDVGQGLSILIQTTKHNVLFDAGPAYPGGYSTGNSIIVPYLRYLGVISLDDVIISHPDLDHIGGLKDVANAVKIKNLYSSDIKTFPLDKSALCEMGTSWEYDEVKFKFLWPSKEKQKSKNNNSCVLLIKTKNNSVLIPGDIEKKSETILSKNQNMHTNLLIAPHHGSKGASSQSFINTFSPKNIVFSTGKYNRFKFPHHEVLNRYQCGFGRRCFNTAYTGTLVFSSKDNDWDIRKYRSYYGYIWL
jgi:competence protein ComEC